MTDKDGFDEPAGAPEGEFKFDAEFIATQRERAQRIIASADEFDGISQKLRDVVANERRLRFASDSVAAGYVFMATGLLLSGSTLPIAAVWARLTAGFGRDHWLATHTAWQERTVWYGILFLAMLLQFLSVEQLTFREAQAGIALHDVLFSLTLVFGWMAYRIVKGIIFMVKKRPMYAFAQGPKVSQMEYVLGYRGVHDDE